MFGVFKVSGLNRRQYNTLVKERLEQVIHIETDSTKNPRFCGILLFADLIAKGWYAKSPPDDTAIHIALSYFMGCAKGDDADTQEGLRIYERLEAFIRVAHDKNLITSQRFDQFREVLDKYYTMIGERVLERLIPMLPQTDKSSI